MHPKAGIEDWIPADPIAVTTISTYVSLFLPSVDAYSLFKKSNFFPNEMKYYKENLNECRAP